MQFQADMLGIPVEVPEIAETTALGAAYLAGLAVGFWDGEQDLASQWRANAHFEPRISNDEADQLYAGWQRAMERARGWGQKSS
jgi:glycerol kinase